MSIIKKITKSLKKLTESYLLKKAEQLQYELKQDIESLEKKHDKSKSQTIWDMLEEKRRELANAEHNLYTLRAKNESR